MAAATILHFPNLKLLTIGLLERAELRRHAKFCRNRLNHGRDMLIFRFFCSTDILSLHLVVGRVIAVKS